MLRFFLVPTAATSVLGLNDFDPRHETWILSDLKSKQEIQNHCFEHHGFYTDDSILRMSDFWRLWLRRLQPQLTVVSDDFIESLIKNYVETYKDTLKLDDNVAQTLSGMIQLAAPVMLGQAGQIFMKDWADQNSDRSWLQWYKIAENCLKFLVWEKKVISNKWSATILLESDLKSFSWPKKLKIDLGAQISSVELALLKELSQKVDIDVYVPNPEWKDQFFYLLKSYDTFLNYGQVQKLPAAVDPSIANLKDERKFIRLSTQLAEVKFAVAQVREWIAQGCQPHEIALVSPKIEEYWALLEDYGRIEGIPFDKDRVSPLGSLSLIQSLVAHLQSLTQEVSFESLQTKLFQGNKDWPLRYEKFKALFAQLYDADDLQRDEKIQELFYKKIDFNQSVSRDEFLSLVLKIWMDLPTTELNPSAIFEAVIKDLMAQSTETTLKLNEWYTFFKNRLSSKEIKIAGRDLGGVHVVSLPSSQFLKTKKRIFLGLVDEFLRQKSSSLIPLQDIELIKKSSDMDFIYQEESYLEFDLKWFAEMPAEESIFLAPEFSFQSDPMNASLFFLRNEKQKDKKHPTIVTRADEIQNKFFHQMTISSLDDPMWANKSFSVERLSKDYTQQPIYVKQAAAQLTLAQLSASEIENYAKCPFKWLAQKGFQLRDEPEMAIDIHPTQKGTLTHALFEYIVDQMKDDAWSFQKNVDTVSVFLDQKRQDLNLYIKADVFWTVVRKKLLITGQRFFDYEKSFPRPLNSKTEIPFEVYFDTKEKKFSMIPSDSSVQIKGRIDRVDQYAVNGEKKSLIYDYKNNPDLHGSHGTWLSNKEFQMLLYMSAVKQTLTENEGLLGALYYNTKDFSKEKGLIEKQFGQNFFGLGPRKGCLITTEDWQTLDQEFLDTIQLQLARWAEGDFTPDPYKDEICKKCDWSTLCRNPKLN